MKDIGREMSVPHFELWEDGRRIPDARQPRHVVPWRRIFRRATDPRNINKHKGREWDGFEIDLMRVERGALQGNHEALHGLELEA